MTLSLQPNFGSEVIIAKKKLQNVLHGCQTTVYVWSNSLKFKITSFSQIVCTMVHMRAALRSQMVKNIRRKLCPQHTKLISEAILQDKHLPSQSLLSSSESSSQIMSRNLKVNLRVKRKKKRLTRKSKKKRKLKLRKYLNKVRNKKKRKNQPMMRSMYGPRNSHCSY